LRLQWLTACLISYACLIVRADQRLFGERGFAEMPREVFELPTKQEIQLEIEAGATPAGPITGRNVTEQFGDVAFI
jgi:hypothetical protein